MERLRDTEARTAAILNAWYMVRHYNRPSQRAQRAQAITYLGLVIRKSFNESDDFKPLIVAILDGGRPATPEQPF